MLHKKTYLILLPLLFLFTITEPGNFDPSERAKAEFIKQTGQVAAKETIDFIDYMKETYDLLKPSERLALQNLELTKKSNELQNKLLDLQIKDAEYGLLIKETEAAKATLSSNDRTTVFKNFKQKFANLSGEVLPEEQNSAPDKKANQPQDLNKTVTEVQTKNSLFAAIATSCAVAATKVGKCADVLAGYSFAYITQHPRLKETFIGKHATGINRALVATTVIIAAYSAYRLYKAKKQTDDDDDDIFADDDNY